MNRRKCVVSCLRMDEQDELDQHLDGDQSENTVRNGSDEHMGQVVPVSGLYKNWFVEYASYVILERAIPAIEDGLKPVQRRILHAMKEMDDGRYNKVANIIGATMAYHPHGDAAIGEALVNMGQKDLLIDTQGNWGDVRTGDSAAAPRYIEARLSPFALEVAYKEETTEWQLSYDGRKREPVTLPMKFPLLLAQGVEGIAVGLSTKIMPHNFLELCEASIDILKGKSAFILPDFPTGGFADFSQYNEGRKGSRIRVRARIKEKDKQTLLVKEIPFGTTTGSLIESIIKANDSGKIKIKKVIDNTARDVEIEIQLEKGTNVDLAINALYAFTDCEISISPLACVIADEKPQFLSVNDILKINTQNTLHLLKRELQIKLLELEEKWHFSSLEKIFIENRIYRDIEECETWEAVLDAIDSGLKPFKKKLKREITRDDLVKLTEIKIKRISKFDSFKADEQLKDLDNQIATVQGHLEQLVNYAIDYFKNLIKKYGKGKERKTEIRTFDVIEANAVAAANVKLYANLSEGFAGTSLKKETFITECSDIDDIIGITKSGKYKILKVSEKAFFGKDLWYVGVWKKNDERTTYNAVYWDPAAKKAMVKRFNITGLIRDKEYDITNGSKGSELLYLTVNPNGEAEKITIYLSHMANARIKQFDYDFTSLAIKGKSAQGNLLTRYPIRKIDLKEKGKSTLGGVKIWFDTETGRLNGDARGTFLGEFDGEDRILVIYQDGNYELTNYELINRYEPEQVYLIQKYYPEQTISAVYKDGKSGHYFGKRFQIETITMGKKFCFVSEEKGTSLVLASTHSNPLVSIITEDKKGVKTEWGFGFPDFVEVRGWKSVGNKLSNDKVKKIVLDSPKVGDPPKKVQPLITDLVEEHREPEGVEGPDGQINLF